MRLEFDVVTDLTPAQVYDFFWTPHNWPRLFTAFDEATNYKDGWVRVPIRRSPFSLTAKVTKTKHNTHVAWKLHGFWEGRGEINLQDLQDGTRITGFEKVRPPRLLGWGGMLERWAEPRFAEVWESGWRRIRRTVRQPSSGAGS